MTSGASQAYHLGVQISFRCSVSVGRLWGVWFDECGGCLVGLGLDAWGFDLFPRKRKMRKE